jgi:hypothetical protein
VLLYKKISTVEYNALFKSMQKYSKEVKEKYYEINNYKGLYMFHALQKYGLTIFLNSKNINGYPYHAIEIRLNPKLLSEEKNYIDVSKFSDYEKISKTFTSVFKPIRKIFKKVRDSKYLIFKYDKLNNYEVKRIDYCINVKVKYSDIVMEMIERANVPDKFSIVKTYDEIGKRMKQYKHSFYIKNKSVCINCYDKHFQLSHEFSGYFDIDKAENIIRFEVQCYHSKTNNMKSKYDFENKLMLNYISDEICSSILIYYYSNTIGTGDYYTLQEAQRIICNQKLHQDTKRRMVELLRLINKKRSTYSAKKEFCENKGNVKEFNTLIKKMNKIGINPVTIPLSFGIEYLPNIINEIEYEFMPIEK